VTLESEDKNQFTSLAVCFRSRSVTRAYSRFTARWHCFANEPGYYASDSSLERAMTG
jgi:hypothetical protein